MLDTKLTFGGALYIMRKYSVETKLKVINAYLNSGESLRTIGNQFNINDSLVHRWVTKYNQHGISAFKNTYTKYSIEFKLDVIKFITETGASIEEATIQFNIPSFSTAWKWWHTFKTQGVDALRAKKRGRQLMKPKTKQAQYTKGSNEELLAQNELLRMEVSYLKKLQALILEKKILQKRKKRK